MNVQRNKRPVIGITMGDPVGIGPEILVSALEDPDLYERCRPVVIGDPAIMASALTLKHSALDLNRVESPEQGDYRHGTIDLLALSALAPGRARPGVPTAETGKAMLSYITAAVDLAVRGDIAAVATCPITKTALKMAESEFHGHTELIASRTGTDQYAMMLAGDTLRVVLVTIHIPVAEVPGQLSAEKILDTIRITDNALKTRFNIARPLIAVAGLNPHAGEESMFGREEAEIIGPALDSAEKEGFSVTGPLPPDTLFYHAAKGKYDAVVCMYHDQGLIPFKMLHFEDGVNTTIGLPIIRTSVDHGTAYDIAWQGTAHATSLKAAVKLAAAQAMAGETL
ncbi:MAG TPA: 4-hydroxythreonine-4-phosphate dehydrogenase PdxA [Desulfobacteraceae bacterium]|nr:4-hydroxythreonine-4-phosphate dehydrogenase PdxA [Desulfobacteraceae bacterium]